MTPIPPVSSAPPVVDHGPIASDDAALYLRDVVKSFGAHTAVNKLSLTAQPGTLLTLLGPNGAGKTTTVEICEGFVQPDSGVVRVLGLDPTETPEAVRSRVGVMLQSGGAYPGAKVGEMLSLTASYSANPLPQQLLIDTLNLESFLTTPFRRLSGGQRQRLSLALALIGRPELVFLDEPTAGMDAQSRHVVWDLIDALRADGVTIVLTTHLMDEAEALSDQIAIMQHGRVIATGTPEELTTATQSGLTAHMDAPAQERSAFIADLAAMTSTQAVSYTGGPEFTLPGVITPEHLAVITASAAQHGVLLTSLHCGHRSLEQVYLDLTDEPQSPGN